MLRLPSGGDEGLHNVELCLNHQTETSQKKFFEVTLFPVQTDIMGIAENLGSAEAPEDKALKLVADGENFAGFYGTARDVTERKKAENLIRFQAFHDLLTGLPNRSLFNDRLELAIAHARRHEQKLAVMFLDLDRFKSVNDTFGHSVGDRLLKGLVARLQNCLREGDTLSRFGGDEFVLLLPEVGGREDLELIAQKIIDTAKQPFELEGQDVFVGISVGIAQFPEYGKTQDVLIKHADIAMYQAKMAGKNGYALFNEAMSSHLSHSLKLEAELHRALENDELRVFYQPQLCTETDSIIGVEALVRWQHPERGLVFPGEFIALAEETKMIIDIGEWVLKKACAEVKGWMDEGLPPVRLAVNFSSLQVEQPGLVGTIVDVLEACDFPPRYFELEITESVMLNDLEGMVKKLQQLADYGVVVAIDDFGTGYSSLSYLHRLPINTVKVDQSFVRNIQSVDREVSIVNAICAMAHGLNLNIIAEGVETQDQYDYLKNVGCQELQGYLISKPLPGDELKAFLQSRA
jgi:diguanylate cyclase (GGDEF)-like protein